MAQDADPKKGAGGGTLGADGKPLPTQDAGAQDAHADDLDAVDPGEKVDPEKFRKVVEDRKRKNEEARSAKAEAASAKAALDAANAKLKAFEDAEEAKRVAGLAEVERERELRKKAEERAQAAEVSAAKAARMSEVKLAGVGAEYVEIVEAQLEAAQKADPKLDISAWMQDRKARMPALFTAAAAEKAAGGAQRSGTTDPALEQARAEAARAKGNDKIFALRKVRALEKQAAGK